MIRLRVLKYALTLTLPIMGICAHYLHGYGSFFFVIYAFGLIPVLELVLPASSKNLSATEEEIAKKDPLYDILIYIMVPTQYLLLILFLLAIDSNRLSTAETIGRTLSFGIACGVFGINVAHELGHRSKGYEKIMAKALLLTSQYMHFFIEHNRGHHRWVSTEKDPASARYGENLYAFYFRAIVGELISAWHIENERVRKTGKPLWSPLYNEMVRFACIQIAFVVTIFLIFSLKTTLCYLCAAFIGVLMLQTVNYIEHYGLSRKKLGENYYEKVLPIHSWNSDHPLGRILLFELTRHSDHHYHAGRKYQVLRHFDQSPQMPTGYPGMMVLASIPPLWFWVMHKQIAKLKAENKDGLALA